jgi:hypothetical protein
MTSLKVKIRLALKISVSCVASVSTSSFFVMEMHCVYCEEETAVYTLVIPTADCTVLNQVSPHRTAATNFMTTDVGV